jgi:hypothetical protein
MSLWIILWLTFVRLNRYFISIRARALETLIDMGFEFGLDWHGLSNILDLPLGRVGDSFWFRVLLGGEKLVDVRLLRFCLHRLLVRWMLFFNRSRFYSGTFKLIAKLSNFTAKLLSLTQKRSVSIVITVLIEHAFVLPCIVFDCFIIFLILVFIIKGLLVCVKADLFFWIMWRLNPSRRILNKIGLRFLVRCSFSWKSAFLFFRKIELLCHAAERI